MNRLNNVIQYITLNDDMYFISCKTFLVACEITAYLYCSPVHGIQMSED